MRKHLWLESTSDNSLLLSNRKFSLFFSIIKSIVADIASHNNQTVDDDWATNMSKEWNSLADTMVIIVFLMVDCWLYSWVRGTRMGIYVEVMARMIVAADFRCVWRTDSGGERNIQRWWKWENWGGVMSKFRLEMPWRHGVIWRYGKCCWKQSGMDNFNFIGDCY